MYLCEGMLFDNQVERERNNNCEIIFYDDDKREDVKHGGRSF